MSVHKKTLKEDQDIMGINRGWMVIKEMGNNVIVGEETANKIHLLDRVTLKVKDMKEKGKNVYSLTTFDDYLVVGGSNTIRVYRVND